MEIKPIKSQVSPAPKSDNFDKADKAESVPVKPIVQAKSQDDAAKIQISAPVQKPKESEETQEPASERQQETQGSGEAGEGASVNTIA